MKAAGSLARLNDLLNPIAVKELRQAVKSRIVLSALMLFLLIQLSILLLNLWFSDRPTPGAMNLHAGGEIFQILQGFLLGTCMLLVPAYAGLRLAAEHSETNVDLLFISTLRPRGIIAGKVQAAIVLILLIFSACAPFMTFTYLLRGIDMPSILILLALDFLVVLLGTQTAIFLGSVPVNMALKVLLGLGGLGLLVVLFAATMGISLTMLERGFGWGLDTVEFWIVAGAAAFIIAAVIGLLFTWSVAIVCPPSANRALPARLYLLGFWLATGGLAGWLTYYFHQPAPLYLWMSVLAPLLCVMILVSINEREQWGVRVARTLPRRWWLRVPLFFFYSGSAGGVLFHVLLLALTIALPVLALEYCRELFLSPMGQWAERAFRITFIVLELIALYTFDYCMLAVWLRNVLLSKWVRPGFTWLLALILFGLGFSVPFLLVFLFLSEGWNPGVTDPSWFITNPLMTIFACMQEGRRSDSVLFSEVCRLFLSGWGLLMLLGCLPWMFRQIRRFHPPEPSRARSAAE